MKGEAKVGSEGLVDVFLVAVVAVVLVGWMSMLAFLGFHFL